jgi:hypothetical protein
MEDHWQRFLKDLRCHLTDTHGRLWSYVEKVPVVTTAALDASSAYRQPGVIACEVVGRASGVTHIDTNRPWAIESVEGETRFEVLEGTLVEGLWSRRTSRRSGVRPTRRLFVTWRRCSGPRRLHRGVRWRRWRIASN